MTYLSSVVFCF